MLTTDQCLVLPEPPLEFRHGQSLVDPHDGLSIFGPYDADFSSHPHNLSYAVVGTEGGIRGFEQWSALMASAVSPPLGLSRRLWPVFPGFDAAFACAWPRQPTRVAAIDEARLDAVVRDLDGSKRASGVVQLYLDGIERLTKSDDPVDVIVCMVPDIVYLNCRPKSRVSHGTGYSPRARVRQERADGQLDLFDAYDPATYQYSVDFRRQLKARAMRFGVAIQLVRESTLRVESVDTTGERMLTPLSDRCWNLGVALYYKAGGKPWRLSSARDGVCYIGIAYRRKDPSSESPVACCAAQLFLDSGDGIVFMGEYGPWYSEKKRAFHLNRGAAKRLLEGALKTYNQLDGRPLREVFLHCRSGIDREEFSGFAEACPAGVQLTGVRVRLERNDVSLYREGTRVVLRGTMWQPTERTAYLWASGFKPRLGSYDGREVPHPLRIELQHGTGDLELISRDILGLTKLNYNACRLGEGEPVTVGFSDAVGEILVSNPTVTERSPKFKFYI